MKSLKHILFALCTLIGTLPLQAIAIENGTSALGNPRVVKLYVEMTSEDGYKFTIGECSAWLYSPRLVFTNSHCVHNIDLKPQKVIYEASRMSAGLPGTVTNTKIEHTKASKIFTYDTFEWYDATPGGTLSFKNDFAILVLEKSMTGFPTAKLATKEYLDNALANKSSVSTAGYGYQNSDRVYIYGTEPKSAKFQLIPFADGMKKVNEFKQKWNRTYFQEDVMFANMPINGAAPCDGDSGSGYYFEENGIYTYAGAAYPFFGAPNCGVETWGSSAVASFRPVYNDLALIQQAEAYVKANPEKIPKPVIKTITCIKSKISKTVKGTNPVCPKGYTDSSKIVVKAVEGKTCAEFGQLSGSLTCATFEGERKWIAITIENGIDGRPVAGTKCYRDGLSATGYDLGKKLVALLCTYKNSPGAFPGWTTAN